MATTIDARERDVQHTFQQALAIVGGASTRSLHQVETWLWTAMLALGRAMLALYLARVVARSGPDQYWHDGARYQLAEIATDEIGTLFGKVRWARPVGRRIGWRRAACDRPIDRALGLCSGFSMPTVLTVARLCAQLAFSGARETFAQFCQWAPSQRSTLRIVDAVGTQARSLLQQAPPPDQDGEILVIQVDGGGAPMIDPAELLLRRRPRSPAKGNARYRRRQQRRARVRPRRKKGDKSKNAKVAFVGVIYTLSANIEGSGRQGPIGKRVYATFDSHAELFKWLHHEATKRGYGKKPTLFLGDGAEAIWEQQASWFPMAQPCIDWVHIVEKLWAVGRCLYPHGSESLAAWVAQRVKELRGASGADKVISTLSGAYRSIPKTGPGTKAKRAKLLEVITHMTKHRHRMPYHQFRRDDLDIGTGAVQGAVRNLVRMRLDGPGMRWSRDRSERVLHLRCVLLNGQWDDFAAHLARQGTLQLAATPTPTRSHAAARKAA